MVEEWTGLFKDGGMVYSPFSAKQFGAVDPQTSRQLTETSPLIMRDGGNVVVLGSGYSHLEMSDTPIFPGKTMQTR